MRSTVIVTSVAATVALAVALAWRKNRTFAARRAVGEESLLRWWLLVVRGVVWDETAEIQLPNGGIVTLRDHTLWFRSNADLDCFDAALETFGGTVSTFAWHGYDINTACLLYAWLGYGTNPVASWSNCSHIPAHLEGVCQYLMGDPHVMSETRVAVNAGIGILVAGSGCNARCRVYANTSVWQPKIDAVRARINELVSRMRVIPVPRDEGLRGSFDKPRMIDTGTWIERGRSETELRVVSCALTEPRLLTAAYDAYVDSVERCDLNGALIRREPVLLSAIPPEFIEVCERTSKRTSHQTVPDDDMDRAFTTALWVARLYHLVFVEDVGAVDVDDPAVFARPTCLLTRRVAWLNARNVYVVLLVSASTDESVTD